MDNSVTMLETALAQAGGEALEQQFEGRTALGLAAASASPEVLALLVNAGAEVDALGPGATTPLMRAAYYGNTGAVVTLLEHGADALAESDSGYAAFDYALEAGQEGIMKILLTHLSTAANAAEQHSLKLVEKVLADDEPGLLKLVQGDHPNLHNPTGYAALPLAVRLNRATLVKTLLNNGADPNIGNDGNDEAGPLHQAARGGHLELATQLLDSGARADKPNARGYTPLMLATGYGHSDIVRLLLGHGADPLRTNDDDQSALSIAEAQKKAELVALLRAR